MYTHRLGFVLLVSHLAMACDAEKSSQNKGGSSSQDKAASGLGAVLTRPVGQIEMTQGVVLQKVEFQGLKINEDFDAGLETWKEAPNPCKTTSSSDTREESWTEFVKLERDKWGMTNLKSCSGPETCTNDIIVQLADTEEPGKLFRAGGQRQSGNCINTEEHWKAELEGDLLRIRYERRARAFAADSQECKSFMGSKDRRADGWDLACSLDITLKQAQTVAP